jgi:hypothetical protein
VLRFVAGSMSDPAREAALQTEQTQHGDILRLPVQVCVGRSKLLRALGATSHPCMLRSRSRLVYGARHCTRTQGACLLLV